MGLDVKESRQFPASLDLVFKAIGVSPSIVVRVFLIGSRLWGLASHSSDYDLYIVVSSDMDAKASTGIKLSQGIEVDVTLAGAKYFQGRLDQRKLKELCCIWAPDSCQLLSKQTFIPKETSKNHQLLYDSLLETYNKDWIRVEKLIKQGKMEHAKKCLAHCYRLHLIAVQIVKHDRVVHYEAAKSITLELHNTFAADWNYYVGRFRPELLQLQELVLAACEQ